MRTGGRLGLFATGGRLLERERLDEAPPTFDEREDSECDVDRDDDGVA